MRQGPIGPSLAPNPRLSVTGMSMPFLFLGYLLDVFLPALRKIILGVFSMILSKIDLKYQLRVGISNVYVFFVQVEAWVRLYI